MHVVQDVLVGITTVSIISQRRNWVGLVPIWDSVFEQTLVKHRPKNVSNASRTAISGTAKK
jgi:hypothetical protein